MNYTLMGKQYIFLSHDVDWSFNGPSKEHILKRKNRFDAALFSNTPLNKLYHNFSEYMEIEEKFNVKSTCNSMLNRTRKHWTALKPMQFLAKSHQGTLDGTETDVIPGQIAPGNLGRH